MSRQYKGTHWRKNNEAPWSAWIIPFFIPPESPLCVAHLAYQGVRLAPYPSGTGIAQLPVPGVQLRDPPHSTLLCLLPDLARSCLCGLDLPVDQQKVLHPCASMASMCQFTRVPRAWLWDSTARQPLMLYFQTSSPLSHHCWPIPSGVSELGWGWRRQVQWLEHTLRASPPLEGCSRHLALSPVPSSWWGDVLSLLEM